MEVKDNVKQRRQERLRHLRAGQTQEGGMIGEGSMNPNGRGVQPSVYRSEQDMPLYANAEWRRRMEDPEVAWKHKLRMDSTLSGGNLGDDVDRNLLAPPSRRSIVAKLLVSCLLFAAVYGMYHMDLPWMMKGRQYVTAALTESYDFVAISAWYTERFGGAPSFIPSFHHGEGDEAVKVTTSKRSLFSPAKGSAVVPYDGTTSLGVMLHTEANAPVYALDTGQVISVGSTAKTGLTIAIRHANGLQSTYGFLSEAHVEINDWINRGEAVGKASKGDSSQPTFYFAVMKDGRPINPTDVISFD